MESAILERLRASARDAQVRIEATLAQQGWLQSLPSRLVLGVFSTVLVTSLAVAFTATRSTEAFLRDEIDQRFPAVLAQTVERVDLWYGQRQLDVDTFARSEIVQDHLRALARGTGGRRGARARDELQRYLDYVLERFAQYDALYLMSRDGELLLWAGDEVTPPESLQKVAPSLERPRVGPLRMEAGTRSQTASAPVSGPDGEPVGSLHAVLALEAFDVLLAAKDLSADGRILVVDGDGAILAPEGASETSIERPEAIELAAGTVGELTLRDGQRVVAARQDFERFGWSLWVTEPYDAAFAPVVSMIRRVWAVNLAIVLLLGGVAYSIARSMARPIHLLSRAAEEIAGGAEHVDIPVVERGDEVGVLSRALREMTMRLAADRSELRRTNEILTQLSVTDGLTGLNNHRSFQDRLVRDVRRAKRTEVPLSLVLLDVDDFKGLNDRYGHATGDRVLAAVSAALSGAVRETDFVARYGGEEFAVLAPVALEGGLVLAENLRRAIASVTIEAEGDASLGVTVSGGVAELETDGEALFASADRALYRAKHSGKDCVLADDPESRPS